MSVFIPRALLGLLPGLLLAGGCAAADAAAPPRLIHDPFDWSGMRPPAPAPAAQPQEARIAAPPKLRAVVRAGPHSMVNLDGAILALGDSAEGYRLVEVRDYSAVFVKDGVRRELALEAARLQ